MVALGSNEDVRFGGAKQIIQDAIAAFGAAGLGVLAQSRLYHTPCFPVGYGPDFVNAAVVLEANLTAPEVLSVLHGIEADFQRERAERWGPRSLDLDLVAMGDYVAPNRETAQYWMGLSEDRQRVDIPDQLILPHPRLQDRSFVLIPLADIAPDWRHPILGKTVTELLKRRPEAEKTAIHVLEAG